jgi:hypothetical protein
MEQDLVRGEVNILHSGMQALHQAQAGTIYPGAYALQDRGWVRAAVGEGQ